MYDNSTPANGSFSSNLRNLVRVSKANLCPHCGKPDWCYSIGELSVCSRDNAPATGWEATSKTDKEGHVFYARPQEKKPARPKQTRYWEYPDRNGSPLVRVERVDDGEGNKKIKQQRWDKDKKQWLYGLGTDKDLNKVARASIPVYRYAEIRKAIAEGQLIFIVDGEQCADKLWEIGLAATTSFGGMGKFSLTDSLDLQGAAGIVITPDRDEPGIKDAEKVAQHFPDALGLYCYPESKAWENLPKSQGLDVFDWIQDRKLSADDIKAAIGEKKVFNAPAPASKPSNLIQHPAVYGVVESPAEEIIDRADKILADELTPTNNLISAIAAAKRAGLSPRDFREILAERQAEQSLDFSILDSISRLKQLHQIQNTPIDLREFFPPALATALLTKAESDRIDPVRILQSFLPVVGTMLGSRVGIELKRGDEDEDAWVEYPIFYTTDVGYPSTGKSATQDSLIRPLQKMQDNEQERLDEALDELVQLEEAWKELSKEQRAEKAESDENPRVFNEKHCKPKKWLLDESSAQALTKRIAEQEPHHGCLLLQDELAGLFDSMDQFTGGKGGQRQFILKAWNKPLRGSVDRVDVKSSYFFRSQTLSITGTIQPDVARRIFNVASDPDGMLSRFLPAIAGIPDNFAQWSNVRVSLNRVLTELIKNLERLPETLLTLPARTADVYRDYWQKLRRGQQINFGDNPAYSYFLGKQLSYVGRFAIVIHCLENLGAPEIPSRVTPETMHKAVRLSLFYCNQFLLLQSKSAQQQPIEGILLDILKFAQEKGGQLSTRDLCRSRFKKAEVDGKKITGSTAGKLLKGIADAGFGFYEECGNSRILKVLSPTVTDCHLTVTSINASDSKDLSVDCHQMTEVYIPKNSDRTEQVTEAFIEEFDTPTSVENIQLCHLVTVEAQNQTAQALEVGDSPVTVGDTGDSLENLLEEAAYDGHDEVKQVAAKYSPEFVQKAIAQIEARCPEVAEEIRDALEIEVIPQQAAPIVDESAAKTALPKKPVSRILEVGDRVSVKDVGGSFHGAKGVITKETPGKYGTKLTVRFDKKVSNFTEKDFIAGDLMKLPPGY